MGLRLSSNHRSEIVIVFDLYEGCGREFFNKNLGKCSDVHP